MNIFSPGHVQMEALRPALQQTVEQWSRFHGDLREVSLQASELRCALQHQRAPLFSLEQAEGYVDLLRVGRSVGHVLYRYNKEKKTNHILYFIIEIIVNSRDLFNNSKLILDSFFKP